MEALLDHDNDIVPRIVESAAQAAVEGAYRGCTFQLAVGLLGRKRVVDDQNIAAVTNDIGHTGGQHTTTLGVGVIVLAIGVATKLDHARP